VQQNTTLHVLLHICMPRFERVISGESAGGMRSMAEVSGEERGSTDAGNRLTHLLRAMAGMPSQVRRRD